MNLSKLRCYNFKNKDKKFKERMKDRYKINGLKFDYSLKDEKKFLIPKKKEKNIREEYEEFMLFKNYNKLKHQIFVREQKEKEIEKKEFFNEIHQDFNYTNLTKIIDQFLSIKKNDKNNPFNYNLQKRKNEVERANRNISKNRINEALKKIVLHFMKIKGKLNLNYNNNTITQETVDEIRGKIDNYKKKLNSRNIKFNFSKNKSDINDKLNSYKYAKKSRSFIGDISSIKNYINISINNKINHVSSSSSIMERKKCHQKSSDIINMTNNSYNYKNYKSSENHNLSEDLSNKINKNKKSSFFNDSQDNENIKDIKHIHNFDLQRKRFHSFVPNINKSNNSNSSLSSILNNKNDDNKNQNDNQNLLIEDNVKSVHFNSLINKKNKYFIKKDNYQKLSRPKSCVDIDFKNKIKFLKRPKSCIDIKFKNKKFLSGIINNKNINRNNSCINRKHDIKVKNLPLYTTKITDLIKEFNRIKKNARKLKINYKEKHFSTYEEIDNIIKNKEDMLMFLLKQKYFKCRFPPKIVKIPNYKKIFVNKMKEYIELTEDIPPAKLDFVRLLE